MVEFKSLVKAGVHFGHQMARWCPKMAPYIWGNKNNIHLIDVSKTAYQMEKAAKFLEEIASDGKSVLWIGTKKPAQEVIFEAAKQTGMPFVNHRWIGGTLSNNSQVKKSVTKLLHYEDIIFKSSDLTHYTKKELNTYQKLVDRLKKNVGGILKLKWPIGAIVLVDVRKEQSALKEAVTMGIPVVALVDTNGDPSMVDYVIPANDDAPRSIKVVIDYLSQAVLKGKELAGAKKEKEQAERKKKIEAQAAQKVEAAKAQAGFAKKKVEAKPAGAKPAGAKPAGAKPAGTKPSVVKAAPKKVAPKVAPKKVEAKVESKGKAPTPKKVVAKPAAPIKTSAAKVKVEEATKETAKAKKTTEKKK